MDKGKHFAKGGFIRGEKKFKLPNYGEEVIITREDLRRVRELKTIADRAKEKIPISETKRTLQEIEKKLPINKN